VDSDNDTAAGAARIVDRLWRAYTPFQRGRNTSSDLAAMLSILMLAQVVAAEDGADEEFVRRWDRAVAEARIGISPIRDLGAALRAVGQRRRSPYSSVLDPESLGDDLADDVPWAASFLTALVQSPVPTLAQWREVCALLFEHHVQDSTLSAGEFFTPREVVRLLVDVAAPEPGDRVLDPACGTGGMLVAVAQHMAEAGSSGAASFEAYATDSSNPRLAMMNMALHGVDRPVVRASDPLSLLQGRGSGPFDKVITNPPFNQRIDDINDVTWPFGPPPEANANFAWLQLAWSRLSETGIAALVMPPRAAWSDNGREAAIRRRMVTEGALLGIIALPSNLFTHTSIPVHIWVLARDKSRHLPPGAADQVLFINASRFGSQEHRKARVLSPEDIEQVSSQFAAWRKSPRETPDEPGFSRSVSLSEILANEASLDPRLYVIPEQKQATAALDHARMLDELARYDGEVSASSEGLLQAFSICERLTADSTNYNYDPEQSSYTTLRRLVGRVVEERFAIRRPGLLLAGPSGSLIRAENYVGAGVPVVMPKDLNDTGFNTADIRCIDPELAGRLDRFRLWEGDVVLARRGELGRCAVVRPEQNGWVCGTGCFVLRPPEGLNPDYFAAYLRSPEARTWLEEHSTGSIAMKTISLKVLGELPVPVPDLATQQAIAAVALQLDENERLLRERLELTRTVRREVLGGILTDRRPSGGALNPAD